MARSGFLDASRAPGEATPADPVPARGRAPRCRAAGLHGRRGASARLAPILQGHRRTRAGDCRIRNPAHVSSSYPAYPAGPLSRRALEELGVLHASLNRRGTLRARALRMLVASRHAATAAAQREFWLEFAYADQE